MLGMKVSSTLKATYQRKYLLMRCTATKLCTQILTRTQRSYRAATQGSP